MTLQNKVQLITYPDSPGGNLPELHYILSWRLPPHETTAFVDLRNHQTRIEYFDPDSSSVATFRV